MDCADCAKTIERGVSKLDGVQSCAINFGTATLKVDGAASRETIITRVKELGYSVEDAQRKTQDEKAASSALRLPSTGLLGFLRFLLSRRDTTLAVIGALLILPSLLFHEILPLFTGVMPESLVLDALAIGALIIAGLPIARSAWRSITINREININVLMTIAAIGAVVIGA